MRVPCQSSPSFLLEPSGLFTAGSNRQTSNAAETFGFRNRLFPLVTMKSLAFVLLSVLFFCRSQAGVNKHRPRSAAAAGQNETTVQNKAVAPEAPCKGVPLDFVFVIDSSRSIRPRDYEKVKTFIINLIQFLEIGSDATRVGLLQYGSVVQPEFSLNAFTTKAEVEQAVRSMKHLATGTMTGLAIQYAMETSFTEADGARPAHLHIPRIAMIVTDGRPQDTVEEVAAQARHAGIQIFAIGVGRVDMNTLKTIGSEPHSEHVHLVASFSQIETLISVFQSKLCGEGSEMCELVDHQCQHACVSSPSAYRCKCREGFLLNPDGRTCKAEDACAAVDHGCHHFCTNLADGYECGCRPGYQLNLDLRSCSKIDFCDLGDHGCQHDCFSTPESYLCRCKRGYVLNPDGKTCSEIDHCADGTHGCEQAFVSIDGSCVCNCRAGFVLRPDGKTCRRLDHCAAGNHGCEQEFTSTEDTCVCKCRRGFALRPDGKTCKKMDPCAEGTHGCEQDFVSAEDSCVCRCRAGFALRRDGKTCQSVDVCQTLKHGCQHECVSTADSYMCRCSEGFVLEEDGRKCRSALPAEPACGDGAMDLVFVIDGSKSMGAANFELVKLFVLSIVESLNVSHAGSHVGLLQYSTKVRTEFTLGQHTSAQAIRQAVSRMQYMGRGSMTGSALRHMFQYSFSAKEGARPNVPHVSIVFTDGRSQDDVSEWANKAKNSGIIIYAVGVGKAIEQELREIASEPDKKHLYYAEDFKDMGEITKKLKSRMCTEKPSDENMCRCENMIMFQNQVTEKLNILVQSIEAISTRLQALENKSALK